MLDHNHIVRSTRISIIVLMTVGVILLLLYFVWFFIYLGKPLSPTPEDWGTFGDYIGGILNPLVASFALYWLVTSVRLQKQELNDTRIELAKASAAQEAQVRMQLLSAQISGWSVRLNNIMRDIQSVREELSFLREGVSSQRYVDLAGTPINFRQAIKEIESLVDDERLLNEMRETIDSEMKKLLDESASLNFKPSN